MNPCTGQQWRHRHRKQTYGYRRGGEEEEGGMSEDDNKEAHTLPYVKQTATENLLYDSGSLTRAL